MPGRPETCRMTVYNLGTKVNIRQRIVPSFPCFPSGIFFCKVQTYTRELRFLLGLTAGVGTLQRVPVRALTPVAIGPSAPVLPPVCVRVRPLGSRQSRSERP